MLPWTEEIGAAPVYVLQPLDTLPNAEDDAWPGEDRTYVLDDVPGALELITRFAVEYGTDKSVVLVTGHAEFVGAIADKLREC